MTDETSSVPGWLYDEHQTSTEYEIVGDTTVKTVHHASERIRVAAVM